MAPANASRISPAVTRSQKQTIAPYAGSALDGVVVTERAATERLADVRHPRRRGQVVAPRHVDAGVLQQSRGVLGERHRRGEPGGADAAEHQVALRASTSTT